MSTFLQRFFRPKWQHDDPATRIQAIQKLDSGNPQELEIILSLGADDPSDDVKAEALSLIDDLKLLAPLTCNQQPEHNTPLKKRLNTIIQDKSASSIALLEKAEQVNLIPWLESTEVIEHIISTLGDESILSNLAVSAKSSRLRQIAAARIHNQDTLKKIQHDIKGKDKTVLQIVKDKLHKIRQAEEQRAAENKSIDELEEQLQHIACSEVTSLTEPKFRALLAKWEKLQPLADTEKSESINRAAETARHRINEFIAQKARQKQEEATTAEQTAERQATLATLEQTKNEINTMHEVDSGRLAALDAVLKTQETRWIEANRNIPINKKEQKQYQGLMTEIRAFLTASRKLAGYQEEICKLLDTDRQKEADVKAASQRLKTLLADINWPRELQEAKLLKRINDYLGIISEIRLQKEEDIKAARRQIESKLAALETEIEEKNLKKSQSLQREIHKRINQLPQKAAQQYTARFSLLHNQVKELEDWHGFATTPKQIDLCKKMEELADKSLDPQYKADKIKALQEQWKRFGGTSDQELWQRFKSASDKAFEPCKSFFNEQNELKKANLNKRLGICQELETLLDSINWDNVDWRGLDKICKAAKREWREAFPIDFKQNKKPQKRFNDLLNKMERRLNQEKAENRSKKEEIVKKAEALTVLDSIQEAVNGAKKLQQEWSSVGITEFSEDRRLWKSFRGHCDSIFAMREKQNQATRQETEEAITEANSIMEKAEIIADILPGDSPLNELNTLTAQLGALALDGKTRSRYLRSLEHCQKEAERKLEERSISNYKALWQSAVQATITSLGGQSDDSFQNDIDRIDQAGKSIAEVSGIKDALQGLAQNRPVTPSATRFHSTDPQDACILIEIATENETPAHLQERRMELQIARLNAGLKGDNSNSTGKLQEITELCVNWIHHVSADRKDEETIKDQARRLEKAFADFELS
ncbi:MAG: hypothetical protein CSB48_07130 [Proteobacteria bacterium]|nr:MAG: hypothetical protein CSB48_07130 [Pseudomonadota bacterium]PIE40153.1 MAG: hypothetical protein CSA51_01945 [Gammaproteobacteria bacterium]